MKYFPIDSVQTSTDYPYGRLRATATFSVEFDTKRGFRSVFQTINPKTGRINNPKKSTYSDFLCMFQDEEGHFKFRGFDIRGKKDVNDVLLFIKENQKDINLTLEMLKSIKLVLINVIFISKSYSKNQEDKDIYTNFLNELLSSKDEDYFLTLEPILTDL